MRRGAGNSLGPCDAAFLLGNDEAQDWLVRFMQRAYRQGVGGVLRDYHVLGGDWGGLDVGSVKCHTSIWWVHGAGAEARDLLRRAAACSPPSRLAPANYLPTAAALLGAAADCRHGAGDLVVPLAHAQWYAERIPGAELHVKEGEGHVSLVGRHADEVVADLLAGLQPQAAIGAVPGAAAHSPQAAVGTAGQPTDATAD